VFWTEKEPYLFDIKRFMPKTKDPEVRPQNKTVCQQSLPYHSDREVVAQFNGGKITSDAGLLLFYALDRSQGWTSGFSAVLSDSRDPRYVRHQIEEMICQRTHQIVAGYEDCNDAQSLRSDPLLKTQRSRSGLSAHFVASGESGHPSRAVGVKPLVVEAFSATNQEKKTPSRGARYRRHG
jgi:hypothetical protein